MTINTKDRPFDCIMPRVTYLVLVAVNGIRDISIPDSNARAVDDVGRQVPVEYIRIRATFSQDYRFYERLMGEHDLLFQVGPGYYTFGDGSYLANEWNWLDDKFDLGLKSEFSVETVKPFVRTSRRRLMQL